MKITVKFSSIFKALLGIDQDMVEIPEDTTVRQLSMELSKKYAIPSFKSEKTFYYVNDKLAILDCVLIEGDQVRVFQMFAGG